MSRLAFLNWMADSIERCEDQYQLDLAVNLFEKVPMLPVEKDYLTEVARIVEDRLRSQNGSVD